MKIAHIEWEKKPRTLGKVQKIKDLEGVGLFHPFKNTQQLRARHYNFNGPCIYPFYLHDQVNAVRFSVFALHSLDTFGWFPCLTKV